MSSSTSQSLGHGHDDEESQDFLSGALSQDLLASDADEYDPDFLPPDSQDEVDDDDVDNFYDADNGFHVEVIIDTDAQDESDGEGEEAAGDDEDENGNNEEAANPLRILQLIRAGTRTGVLTRGQLLALMHNPNLTNVLFQDDPESDIDFLNRWAMERRRTPKDPNRFPKVPSEEGSKLMRSGAFGANDYNLRAKKHLAQRMLDRELGIGNREDRRRNNDLLTQSLLPRSRAEHIIHFDDPVYSGQFSDDGNFFFACSQDFKVRMYDTSNPYRWRHYKTVGYPWGQWTLTDASLSPDNKWLAYTSIQPMVSIAPTDPNDEGDPYLLDLDDGVRRGFLRRTSFGIWSVRFSGDGREIVAGTSASSIVVYDIESRTVLHHIPAQARALCNSSQYYALYVIVLDLLMYNEPMEKTRSERLEKIILASDFSDLSGAPAKVQKLQQRISHMEEIKEHFQIYSKYLDKRGWEDRLRLERDIAACEDELFFLMKAITSSQRKYDVNTNTSGLLRWNISVRDIVWHLMQDSNEPLVELQLKDLEYDRTDNSDGSHINLIRVGKVLGLNLLPDATYPEMIAPFIDTEKPLGPDMENKEMIRVYWYMLEAIAGIPVMDRFEVNVLPIKIQIEHELGARLFEYIFPGLDDNKLAGDSTKNDSPFIIKQMGDADEEYDESLASTNDQSESSLFDKDSTSFSTRPGSLELRLRPTLSSSAKADRSSKKALSINSGDGHSFRLFRAPTPRTMLKKPSRESLRSSSTHRNALARTSTGHSSRDTHSIASTDKRGGARFGLGKKSEGKEQPSDDLTRMMTRASHYMTFSSIKMPSVVLCLSYKGKEQRNFADVHDFVFRMPGIEWQNKTWSNLDLALALKKAVVKALISHTGALIGNKFSKHRPNAEQRNKLRELATSSVLIAPSSSGASQHYPGSIDSDDSSSKYGKSFVDFSRSPPRSLHGSTHGSIPASNSSRRRSRSSSVTSRRSSRTTASGAPGPNIPTYLMMTPPTPIDDPRGRQNHGIELLRPGTSSGFSMVASTHHGQTLRRATPIDRPQTSMSSYDSVRRKNGNGNFKDKLSALTARMGHWESNGLQDEETEKGEDLRPPSRDARSRRLSWSGAKSR